MTKRTLNQGLTSALVAFAALAALLLLGAAQPALAQSKSVTGLRLGVSPERTRVVVDLSAATEYRFFRLSNPERLVLDLSDTGFSAESLPDNFKGSPILGIDHSPRAAEDLRIVVNLASGNYQTRHFSLTPNQEAGRGHRLVVDIWAESDLSAEVAKAAVSVQPVEAVEPQKATAPIEPAAAEETVVAVAAAPLPKTQNSMSVVPSDPDPDPEPVASSATSTAAPPRRKPKTGTLVDFSGTWQHEWAFATEPSESQKFESIVQPRWDVRFANGVDLTAILRVRLDGVGDLGPTDRRPPNYSDISAPWFNSGEAEVSLRELFVDFQLGNTDWRLGKQQVVWGQADGIKVLDVVNPQSFREFILDDFDDSRIPLWTANVTVPVGDAASLQLLWIPDTTYHELAELDTPFGFSSPRIIPQVPITGLLEADKPDNIFSDSDAGFALSGFVAGWDLSLNYLYRYLDAPVLPVRVRGPMSLLLEPEYQRSHLLGGAFSNAFGDVTLRGELAYNSDTFQPTNTLANEAVAESGEFSALIGVDWALSMDALISAQIFNSYLFDHVDSMGRDESEQTLTLLYQQDFANATWRFRGIGIHSINDSDTQLQLKLSYWLASELQLWLGADTFSGNRQGLFGQFGDNDRVLVGFEYGF
ncbi:AMIN domain-containing protein [Congregibacter variabilis]|uniref:AMIN domain-containing protein n=1 Tax=Congregibacter variabilis TaxID=3081200 RepID=A0ABZ0I7N5_9GAMM|nr:AMIN domain-containing protein [Congregibacter sp. IMCC43200]